MSHTYQRGDAVEVDDGGIWYAATYRYQLRPGKHQVYMLDGPAGGSITEVNSAQIRPAATQFQASWVPPASWAAFRDNPTPAPAPAPARCTCGGWTVGTHSSFCDNPNDNKPRPKGLVRKTA